MSLLYDVVHVTRSLARQPGVWAVAVATLALGLGLNSAIFAVAYGVLWRPLPFPDADRLVTVATRYHQNPDIGGVGLDQFGEWTDRLRTADLAGHQARERTLRGAGTARIITAAIVTPEFFTILGVPASQGVAPPLAAGDPRVVVSPRLAQMLESTPAGSALGQTITIGEDRFDVAGVMPPAFAFPSANVDAWIGLPAVTDDLRGNFELVGRLRTNATVVSTREDAIRVIREINNDEWNAIVTPLGEALLSQTRPAVLVSLGAAVLVLMVACANTVTLLLSRSLGRNREFALRLALGAGPGGLLRAAAIEGMAVATGGALAGLFIAWAALELFTSRAAGVLPRASEIALDGAAIAATLVMTLAVAVVCGGAAAVGAIRRDGAELLRGTVRTATPGTRRVRATLVSAQLALSVVLLTGAGLLVRSVDELLSEDGGFTPDSVVTARLMLDDSRLTDDGATTPFVDLLLERVRALPSVEAAGVGSLLPPTDAPTTVNVRFRSDTRDRSISLSFGAVTSGFLEALGTPLRDGRHFSERDERAEVAGWILSESASRFFYPETAAVGSEATFAVPRFALTREGRMLGVVADMKYAGLESVPEPSVYVPWQLRPMGLSHLVVRTSGDPAALLGTLRTLLVELNPNLPAPDVRTLDDHIADSIAGRRLQLLPAAAVGILALVVAMVGLFGTLGRAVTERRQELSIRAAVGASPARLVRLVLRGSLTIAFSGLVAGLGAAGAAGRGLSNLLYGVRPYDPITFVSVGAVVLVATVVASFIPARRAARLDPLIALKGD